MRRFLIVLFLPILALPLFFRCQLLSNEDPGDDDFYSYDLIGDLYRIPLFEPREITNPGFIEESWFFDLPYANAGVETIAVDEIGAVKNDSIIVSYSKSIYFQGKMSELWLVVDMKEKMEFPFQDSVSFKQSKYGHIRTIPCSEVFEHFEAKHEWIHFQ